jgi:peptide/nickel transport system permease protein
VPGRGVLMLVVAEFVQGLAVVWAVVTVVFFLGRVTADPGRLLAPLGADEEVVQRIRSQMGLDRPLTLQYVSFLGGAARLDMGTSIRTNQPAVAEVVDRLPKTLELGVAALSVSLLGIPLGVLSAVTRGTALDLLARLLALIGQATPSFWLGLMLIFFFGVRLRLLPTGGAGGFDHVVLPAVTLGAAGMAVLLRLTRSSLLEVLSADYVRTARAKGLPELALLRRHALRNALLPLLTVLGLQVGRLLAGAIVVETVFGWPGVGRLMVASIASADYPVVQAGVVVIAASIVLANLAVDLSYRLADPRIRAL